MVGDWSKAKVKIVGKAFVLQNYQKSSNNCSLFDSAAFVYIFSLKKRFSNFKRPAKRQRFYYSRRIVPIEGWEEVALFLKIENWTLILVLKNII